MTTALVPVKKGKFIPQRRGMEHYYPPLPDYIITDEAQRIIEAAKDKPRDYLFFELLWNSGLRVSEALSLTPSHFRDNALRVKGKGGKWRVIPLKGVFFTQMVIYCHDKFKAYDLIFPFTRSQAHRLLSKYAKRAGIERKLHCHLFRHGFAVNFLKQVPNLVYLQELLGHSSIETTRIYTRAALPDVREAIEKMVM